MKNGGVELNSKYEEVKPHGSDRKSIKGTTKWCGHGMPVSMGTGQTSPCPFCTVCVHGDLKGECIECYRDKLLQQSDRRKLAEAKQRRRK